MPAVSIRIEMSKEAVIRGERSLIDSNHDDRNGCGERENSSQCFAEVCHSGVRYLPSYTTQSMASFQLTYSDVLTLLSIVAVGMLIILLYNLIFFSMSLRRISERIDDLSKDIEAIVLKPIGALDYVVDWFIGAIEGMQKGKEKKHHKDSHKL